MVFSENRFPLFGTMRYTTRRYGGPVDHEYLW